jgi:hypothetical protein
MESITATNLCTGQQDACRRADERHIALRPGVQVATLNP